MPVRNLHVAIYRSSSIGDVVLATACIGVLRQLPFPVKISWIGRQPAIALIRTAFPDVHIVELKDAPIDGRVADALGGVHLLVDLQSSLRSHMFGRKLRTHGTVVVRMEKYYRRRILDIATARIFGRSRHKKFSCPPEDMQYRRMTNALMQGLRSYLSASEMENLQELTLPPKLAMQDVAQVRPWTAELARGRWVAVAPGATHPTKQAPLEKLVEILGHFQQSLPSEKSGLLLLGSEAELGLAGQLIKALSWQGPILNLTGKISLADAAASLSQCKVLLTNDSGLAHIAEAVGTPVAVLFGPTVETFGFAPHLSSSRAFSTSLGCRPCSKHGSAPCRFGDLKCFYDIDSPLVAQHLVDLWQRET